MICRCIVPNVFWCPVGTEFQASGIATRARSGFLQPAEETTAGEHGR